MARTVCITDVLRNDDLVVTVCDDAHEELGRQAACTTPGPQNTVGTARTREVRYRICAVFNGLIDIPAIRDSQEQTLSLINDYGRLLDVRLPDRERLDRLGEFVIDLVGLGFVPATPRGPLDTQPHEQGRSASAPLPPAEKQVILVPGALRIETHVTVDRRDRPVHPGRAGPARPALPAPRRRPRRNAGRPAAGTLSSRRARWRTPPCPGPAAARAFHQIDPHGQRRGGREPVGLGGAVHEQHGKPAGGKPVKRRVADSVTGSR